MIYLDNAATTPITWAVKDVMRPYLFGNFANPSAQYSMARRARLAIERARKQVADAINAEPHQIFFTSGATESNNIVMRRFKHTICSNVEHPSVEGLHFNILSPNYKQELDEFLTHYLQVLGQIGSEIPYADTVVSCQWVNNETGNIFPVDEVCKIVHKHQLPFHTDATQAFGHVPIDVKTLDCDFLSLSGHKFHAPKGIGVLYIKQPDKFQSDIVGGGQEKNIRSGTENVAGIVGVGVAAEKYKFPYGNNYQLICKRRLIDCLTNSPWKDRIIINSPDDNKHTANIVNFSIKGVDGESLLLLLDNKEICVSAGSACHSGDTKKSKVLEAIGVPDDYAYGTIRVSMSDKTDIDHIDAFCGALFEILRVI